jgi:hypothetical protein
LIYLILIYFELILSGVGKHTQIQTVRSSGIGGGGGVCVCYYDGTAGRNAP